MIRKRVRAAFHGLTDTLGSSLPSPKMYADGFGDRAALEGLVGRVRDYDMRESLCEIDVDLRPIGASRRGGVFEGAFQSPVSDLLPPEVARARFELHVPGETLRPSDPVCLILAATGDEGYGLRRRLAAPLAEAGVASLLLENPYYGSRRPLNQKLSLLRTVRDQFAMNCATVDETRAILAWLRNRGHERIATAGYSQGAMMATFGAALSDFDVACVPRGGALRAAPIFVEDALQRRFDWGALAAEVGSLSEARRYFAQCLEPVDASQFAPPRRTDAAIIIGCRYDRYVAPAEVTALSDHWAGSELRWANTGHLTGALMGISGHASAIVESLGRL